MRDYHKNLVLLVLAGIVISFAFITWRHAENIQGQVVKGYVLRNFEGKEITPKGDLTVGVITPLSGPYKFIGDESVKGFELAKDALASQGKTIHIIYKDSECDPAVANRRADELMQAGVWYIIGADCYGKDPLTVDGVSMSLNPSREADNPYSFSLASPLDDETKAFFARTKAAPETLSLITVDDAFGNDYSTALKGAYPGRILSVYTYGVSQDAFEGIANKVKERDPEAVFIVAENTAQLQGILAALFARDFHNQVYTNVPVTQGFLDSLGTTERFAFEGLTFASDLDPISSRNEATAFFALLKDTYQSEPTTYAAEAYDSAILLSRMTDKFGKDPGRVGDAMHSLLNHEGVTGLLSINGNSVTRSTYVRTVRNGKIVDANP